MPKRTGDRNGPIGSGEGPCARRRPRRVRGDDTTGTSRPRRHHREGTAGTTLQCMPQIAMNLLLIIVGVALLVFGAVVLIRFADRPGATIRWLGLEISSKGAGLPLIALGVLCMVLAVGGIDVPFGAGNENGDEPATAANSTHADTQGSSATPVGEDARRIPPQGISRECLDEVAGTVSDERVREVEAGMSDLELFHSAEPKEAPFVLVLAENGTAVGALRIRPYLGPSAGFALFKVESAVDAACRDVDRLVNVSRGGDPRALQNWDTVRIQFGEREYDLRIGGEGEIGVGYFRRAG